MRSVIKTDYTPIKPIGNRLRDLRNSRGMTQQQFADDFARFIGSESQLLSSISSWERNQRLPNLDTFANLALYFNVSMDYLLGLTDEKIPLSPNNKPATKDSPYAKHEVAPIINDELPSYDGLPVYVNFKNHAHVSQWGILDYKKKRVICKDFVISICVQIDLYAQAQLPAIRRLIKGFDVLKNSEFVWIEMISDDKKVNALYDGRYRHSDDHTFLINMTNGLTLPYTGFEISYLAYKG